MASASFRDSMNSLGWSRREPDLPVNTAPPSLLGRIQSLNPFGEGGYVRLPITETNPGAPLPAPTRREEEEGWFALSRWDRLLVFGGLLLAALAMFAVCIGLMFTPLFIVKPRKFAILTILTFIAAIVQLVCLLWYIVSYFPMGSSGLRFAARFGGNRVAAWMND
ncbi:Got1 domain containing protein [Pyrenophora tritici-repentis]|uniref:Got1/Sft2 protein n=1 Tax=Pyrenophora tritici-repentis TaxID=45151 RepID=A0A2W1HNR6_9PLEO|nr:SFT2 Membrane protein involved in ER to Golgi transport [Pyrenophora tritici-repentis]KAG9377742.1 SFT2 Membrane protein [Pyrenophora tritici-repentis]KAI0572818.1 SFT2 Membrane protein involved in ER to Golgi transport [Pyrenophora tritici-repentis]KAI0587645.1 SFT2 Membrane protein involved in ER to Golgi transport [Pyrenophora tritici-repentis]KAI0611026.1 SFT2 Membrane protein involved in ER to Golgi transport [Pyrenophora tritici-repentis]